MKSSPETKKKRKEKKTTSEILLVNENICPQNTIPTVPVDILRVGFNFFLNKKRNLKFAIIKTQKEIMREGHFLLWNLRQERIKLHPTRSHEQDEISITQFFIRPQIQFRILTSQICYSLLSRNKHAPQPLLAFQTRVLLKTAKACNLELGLLAWVSIHNWKQTP